MSTDDQSGRRALLWLAISLALVVAAVAFVVCGSLPSADDAPSVSKGAAPELATAPDLAAVVAKAPLREPGAPVDARVPPSVPSAGATASDTRPPNDATARGSVLVEGEDKRSAAPVPEQPAGSLDKEVIRSAIAAIKPKIAECYESALAHDPDLQGKVVVDFTIEAVDGGGGVTAGEVNQTDMNAPFFEACVLKQVVDVPFPAPAGAGVVKVSYPFSFSNGAD
ncbi:MAG: AgmX/PglI C-terminal domain-containing protein [Deltaproteobacteria bacterium]|nr:AgmX/PglI C-terminal domain-containing protein [Deltaproteobacteria bacterium]